MANFGLGLILALAVYSALHLAAALGVWGAALALACLLAAVAIACGMIGGE